MRGKKKKTAGKVRWSEWVREKGTNWSKWFTGKGCNRIAESARYVGMPIAVESQHFHQKRDAWLGWPVRPFQNSLLPLLLRWPGGHTIPHAFLISGHVYVLWTPLCPHSSRHLCHHKNIFLFSLPIQISILLLIPSPVWTPPFTTALRARAAPFFSPY